MFPVYTHVYLQLIIELKYCVNKSFNHGMTLYVIKRSHKPVVLIFDAYRNAAI